MNIMHIKVSTGYFCSRGENIFAWNSGFIDLKTFTSSQLTADIAQEFDYIEYFAGKGNLTRMMRSAEYKSVRLDLKDHTPEATKNNFMDLSHAAGFAFLRMHCWGSKHRNV